MQWRRADFLAIVGTKSETEIRDIVGEIVEYCVVPIEGVTQIVDDPANPGQRLLLERWDPSLNGPATDGGGGLPGILARHR